MYVCIYLSSISQSIIYLYLSSSSIYLTIIIYLSILLAFSWRPFRKVRYLFGNKMSKVSNWKPVNNDDFKISVWMWLKTSFHLIIFDNRHTFYLDCIFISLYMFIWRSLLWNLGLMDNRGTPLLASSIYSLASSLLVQS